MVQFNKESQRGVSLVELSISVSIIGILLAGTLGGMSLLKASKLRRISTEFTNYTKAVSEFDESYQYLPGDLPTANSFWLNADVGNGNGAINWDGAIPGQQEDLYVWEHLGLAGLVAGTFTGNVTTAGTIRYTIDSNAPSSDAFSDMVFVIYNLTVTIYSKMGTVIEASTLSSGGLPSTGGLTGKDAYSIDMKLDDGKASSGTFYSYREAADTGCTDNPYTSATATYDLSSTVASCQLLSFYKQAPGN
jgi:prepilin-type N-terminal cleavage/methylation domain-containing protein